MTILIKAAFVTLGVVGGLYVAQLALKSSGPKDAVPGASLQDIRNTGKSLLSAKGCVACHSDDGSRIVGPTFKGMYGSKVTYVGEESGKKQKVTIDENMIRGSLQISAAEATGEILTMEGYPPSMPSYKGLLTDEEETAIVQYLKSDK